MIILVGGLDIETTGLSQKKGHRILEYSQVIYRYDDAAGVAEYKGKFTQRINPQRSIDPSAFEVHGISFEDVAHCPTLEEVAPKIVRLMSACDAVVAHNGDSFDLPFITAELLRIGSPIPNVQSIDTCTGARWATPNGKLPTLKELCFACDVPYDPEQAHGAEYDCMVMMECFFKVYKQGFFTLPSRAEKEAA